MTDSFQEWVEMQGRPVHPPPYIEKLEIFQWHVSDLHNAQSKELDLYSDLLVEDISIPVSTDSQNQFHTDGPDRLTAEIQARAYTPVPCTGPCPLVVYFRGELVAGDLETEETTCRQLAKLGKYVVLNVNYRNAPRYRYPTPLQDCWDAVDWVGLPSFRFSV